MILKLTSDKEINYMVYFNKEHIQILNTIIKGKKSIKQLHKQKAQDSLPFLEDTLKTLNLTLSPLDKEQQYIYKQIQLLITRLIEQIHIHKHSIITLETL